MTAAGLALSSYVMLMPTEVVTEAGEKVGGVLPMGWTGSNGVITAIIISFAVSYIYCFSWLPGIPAFFRSVGCLPLHGRDYRS